MASQNLPGVAHRTAVRLATLLAFGAGAMDAISFSRLGDVFAGVMTGNLVLFGLSLGSGQTPVVGRVGVALVAFAVGVFLAGLVTRRSARYAGGTVVWPRRVTRVLQLELALVVVFLAGWQAADARPSGFTQVTLLAMAALAMGLQSGAVVAVGVGGLSTTYLTGTLTGILTQLAHTRRLRVEGLTILAALVTGAATAAFLISHAPRLAPGLPLGAVGMVTLLAARSSVLGLRSGGDRRPTL